jgi:hypothetical protein
MQPVQSRDIGNSWVSRSIGNTWERWAVTSMVGHGQEGDVDEGDGSSDGVRG